MMIVSQKLLRYFIAFNILFLNQNIQAKNKDSKGQFRVHLGMVNGSFSGPVTGAFSVMPSFNFEYERFLESKKSYFGRTILAVDSASGKMAYSYLGFGFRYYFKSRGTFSTRESEDGSIQIKPKWRYYAGPDFGISRVLVDDFSLALSAVSDMVDLGGHVGVTKQIGENWGLDAQFGASYGWSFSAVAVTGIFMRATFGGTYYF